MLSNFLSHSKMRPNKTYHINIVGFVFEEADISWFYALHSKDVVHRGQDQRGTDDSSDNGSGDQTAVRCVTNNSFSHNNTSTSYSVCSVRELTRCRVSRDDGPMIIGHIIWTQEKVLLEAGHGISIDSVWVWAVSQIRSVSARVWLNEWSDRTLPVSTHEASLLQTVVIIPRAVVIHLHAVLFPHVAVVKRFVGFSRSPVCEAQRRLIRPGPFIYNQNGHKISTWGQRSHEGWGMSCVHEPPLVRPIQTLWYLV